MTAALSISFFVALMSLVVGVGYWLSLREPVRAAAGSAGAEAEAESPDALPEGAPLWIESLHQVGAAYPSKQGAVRRERERFNSAGLREDWIVVVLHGAKLVLGFGLPVLTVVAFVALGQDLFAILAFGALACYVGARFPEWFVDRRIKSRRANISQGLPDVLDLLVISIESGLSLDSAVQNTAEDLASMHPVITDELNVFQYEVRAGTSRAEALRNLGRRAGDPDMRKLTSLLIQADRFGTSVSKVLRTQARYMRLRRRQSAEEKAHKVGVKLIFPIFFLIMPSMFLVTLGPAVLQLLSNLGKFSGGP